MIFVKNLVRDYMILYAFVSVTNEVIENHVDGD